MKMLICLYHYYVYYLNMHKMIKSSVIGQGAFRVQKFGDLRREFDKLQYYL